ncbi:MAG TPA: vanadium-dependent haloperoxidase, partial [Thermoanaerobaculia bacterium]|nr:vanadium-dependent haloperoxidase [Thermoanaerobaculia bacterium]
DPQSGLAFDLEGADAFAFTIPPAPALASAQEAGEMVELYWMALLRDVNFTDYATDPSVAAACADLNALSDFRGPRAGGLVTPQTLFRDRVAGGTVGPYMSQFMWLPTPFGAEFVDRHLHTYLPDTDQMTDFADWLVVQNGGPPPGALSFDEQRRYLRNGRDLAAWVRMDILFQAYFNACLVMIMPPTTDVESSGLGCPLNPSNPYIHSRTQTGFGTFGSPWAAGLVTEVATRALKATWRQKWFVHRRLRPEEFGGLVHVQKTANRYPGTLHADVLDSPVLDRIGSRFGSLLHPQAFPEGCPTHPSYTAGHATVAGACVTVLKAIFDESFVIQNPVEPTPDGLSLVPYQGAALTVGGELNKLASNIATGRNIAGVHWRSDAAVSLALGEQVAIHFLTDLKNTYNEARDRFFPGFSFTTFDGRRVTI